MSDNDSDLNKQVNLENKTDMQVSVTVTKTVKKEGNKEIISLTSNITEEISSSILNNLNSKLSFIGQYFNVETDDIMKKLKSSLIPINKTFSEEVEQNPDLYGPFWLLTTLILATVVTANFSRYLQVIF